MKTSPSREPASYGSAADTALKLFVVLSRAHRAISEHTRRDQERHGLGATEFAVLEALYHKGPLLVGEVGARILLTSGSTTYVVDKLEQRGLVSRRPCDTDRRALYVDLTREGKALIRRIFPDHAKAVEAAMAGLNLEEQEQAIGLLKRLGLAAQDSL
jgi:MarR family 2-MHQ and catechol resistance regulon transcriptional repressor